MNTIDILKTHNAWRRGDDTRSMDDLGFNVTELGIAIDDAVRAISERDQLRAEPVAYAVFADNGNIRIWSADPIQAETLIQEYGDRVRPLYAAPHLTERQSAPDVAGLVEALEDIGASWHGVNTELERYMRNVARLALAAHRKGGEA